MKTILLLRHAEAAPIANDDRKRPLTSRGRTDSEMLARKMSAFKLTPDYVVCSPARRARETFECMEKILPGVSVIYPEYLYNASSDELFESIRKLTDTAKTVLMVAHNPGIHNLATQLAGKGDHENINALHHGYKPGTMSVIECNCDNWAAITLGENKLAQIIKPG
jgi:phosphohistidine phosphatase